MGNLDEKFFIEYKKIYDIYWDSYNSLTKLINDVELFKSTLTNSLNSDSIRGQISNEMKCYFNEVHMPCLDAILATAQTMIDLIALYKCGYYGIDTHTGFVLPEESIEDIKTDLAETYNTVSDLTTRAINIIAEIQDCCDINQPTMNSYDTTFNTENTVLNNLIEKVRNQEDEHTYAISATGKAILDAFGSALNTLACMAFYDKNSYVPYSVSGSDPLAELNGMTKLQKTQHSYIKNDVDTIIDNEKAMKAAAEKQMAMGVLKVVVDVVVIATSVAVIIGTCGAGAPIAFTIAGSTGVLFKLSDTAEDVGNAYLASTGDIHSSAGNILKDNVFRGNDTVYNVAETTLDVISGAGGNLIENGTEMTAKTVAKELAKEGTKEASKQVLASAVTYDVTKLTGSENLGNAAGFVSGFAFDASVKAASKHFSTPPTIPAGTNVNTSAADAAANAGSAGNSARAGSNAGSNASAGSNAGSNARAGGNAARAGSNAASGASRTGANAASGASRTGANAASGASRTGANAASNAANSANSANSASTSRFDKVVDKLSDFSDPADNISDGVEVAEGFITGEPKLQDVNTADNYINYILGEDKFIGPKMPMGPMPLNID